MLCSKIISHLLQDGCTQKLKNNPIAEVSYCRLSGLTAQRHQPSPERVEFDCPPFLSCPDQSKLIQVGPGIVKLC